jgi:hypothetical protein
MRPTISWAIAARFAPESRVFILFFFLIQAIENKSKKFEREALSVTDLFVVFTTP